MEYELDAVVPVLMPSPHLSIFRESLKHGYSGLRINYVLDFGQSEVDALKIERNLKPFERCFTGNFGSPGAARNHGLQFCEAEYVCFWDIDDQPQINETVDLARILKANYSDVGIGNWTKIGNPQTIFGTSPKSVGKSPGIWRFVMSRHFISDLKFTDYKWGEDQLFLIQMMARKPKITCSQKTLYSYSVLTQGALTTNKSLVSNLADVSEASMEFLPQLNGGAKRCGEIMVLRQIITILKYGNWIMLWNSLKSLQAIRPRVLSVSNIARTWIGKDEW